MGESAICVDGQSCCPDWYSQVHTPWRKILDRLTCKRLVLQPTVGMYKDEKGHALPGPKWKTMVSLVDGDGNEVDVSELNELVIEWINKVKIQNFSVKELI